jgi:hypothetical protein
VYLAIKREIKNLGGRRILSIPVRIDRTKNAHCRQHKQCMFIVYDAPDTAPVPHFARISTAIQQPRK